MGGWGGQSGYLHRFVFKQLFALKRLPFAFFPSVTSFRCDGTAFELLLINPVFIVHWESAAQFA